MRFLYFFLIYISLNITAYASNDVNFFQQGVDAYNNENYEKSIELFEKLYENGIQNGKICYNIANAYFKAKDIGKAILWYERAKKKIKNDPDLNFNYAYVKNFVQDKQPENKSFFYEIIFFWKKFISKSTSQMTALFLNMIFFILLSLYVFKQKTPKLYILIFCFISQFFITSELYDFYQEAYNKEAIIITKEVSILSGFGQTGVELFKLHSGTKVLVKEEKDEYVKIFFEKGKIGWINKQNIIII